MKTIDSADLLGEIRAQLAGQFESAASYREERAVRYPQDTRNARSAYELRRLAEEMRSNDEYNETPALRTLLGLVIKHDIDLSLAMLAQGDFNMSIYRFYDPREDEDGFLERVAHAAEEWWAE